MSAFNERRVQDVQKLRQLAGESGARLKIGKISGNPPNEIEIDLHLRTAPSKEYPIKTQEITKLTIALPARYPLVEPIVSIKTPILHPNVYTSGKICLGLKWMPSFGLDLLVRRIAQIITFDPSILNEQSPANGDALNWYREARRKNAGAFPTDAWDLSAPDKKKIKWSNTSAEATKVVVKCVSCGGSLSLPAGRSGKVNCPRCGHAFEATT